MPSPAGVDSVFVSVSTCQRATSFGCRGIFDADDPQRAGRVVGQVDVVAVDEGAVDAAGDRLGVLGEDLRDGRDPRCRE